MTTPPPPMYSGPPAQLQSYSEQPLQAPCAAVAAAWDSRPQATYGSANECKALQVCDNPKAVEAEWQPRERSFAQKQCFASAFHRVLTHYLSPQLSSKLEMPQSISIVYQPQSDVTTPSVVKSYLAWSLVSIIILFWPLGILALVYSLKVRCATTRGDKNKYSLLARNLNLVATIVGLVLVIIRAPTVTSIIATCCSYYTNTDLGANLLPIYRSTPIYTSTPIDTKYLTNDSNNIYTQRTPYFDIDQYYYENNVYYAYR